MIQFLCIISLSECIIRPHRTWPRRCGLLVRMSHVPWSVCLSLCAGYTDRDADKGQIHMSPSQGTVHWTMMHIGAIQLIRLNNSCTHIPRWPVAPTGRKGEASSLWVDVQKLCNMIVCAFIVMELLRITRQIHRKAVEQRATLIHRPGLGDFVLQTPYRPIPHFPPVTKSWRRHWCWHSVAW